MAAADTPGCLVYSLRIEESDPGVRAAGDDMPVMTQYDTGASQPVQSLLEFCFEACPSTEPT